MKLNSKVVLGLLGAYLLSFGSIAVADQWEYTTFKFSEIISEEPQRVKLNSDKVLHVRSLLVVNKLNELGKEGWELVTCPPNAAFVMDKSAHASSYECILKRQVP